MAPLCTITVQHYKPAKERWRSQTAKVTARKDSRKSQNALRTEGCCTPPASAPPARTCACKEASASKETRDGRAETGIGAVVAVSAGSAVVVVPVVAGVSDVLAPVWSRACPAAAGTSDRAWGCPCLEERTAREGRVRWHALDDPHSAADRHSLCDWRAARSALLPPVPLWRRGRGMLRAGKWLRRAACRGLRRRANPGWSVLPESAGFAPRQAGYVARVPRPLLRGSVAR